MIYPSALFSLERDEILPYERFAYSLLHLAVEALNAKSLPEQVVIQFWSEKSRVAPWTINASVQCEFDSHGQPVAFRFLVPELVPCLLYLFCQTLGADLLATGSGELRRNLQSFADGGSSGIREYEQRGLAHAIRASYDHYGLTVSDYARAQHSYDLLTKLLVYHEIGHAYADHLTRGQITNAVTRRGLELIADMLATTWFYNNHIKNTPDDDGYRQMRGFASHSEAVFANCVDAQRAHLTLVALMAFAGAQRNRGEVTLEGGVSHPPGMQRHMVQHVHLGTLIQSNFSHVLSVQQIAAIDEDWSHVFENLVAVGIITQKDLHTHLDTRECDTIEAAAHAIEEMHVHELQLAVPVLLQARDLLEDTVAGRRPSSKL